MASLVRATHTDRTFRPVERGERKAIRLKLGGRIQRLLRGDASKRRKKERS